MGAFVELVPWIVGVLGVTNAFSYLLFAIDKKRARTGDWRISEQTLLLAAFFGGGGAKLAQHRLRHKTKKEPFRTWLNIVVVLQILVGTVLFFPPARIATSETLSNLLIRITASETFSSLLIRDGQAHESGRVMPRRFGPGSD
ncbi:DUF1294 domain-containing protein [Defluviimonas sp. WL0024]|uniref:DUF1294 domain-containing protein n=2 Tax=Albidovulum TaxID=205889 RepID=A0ABT3J546_9RHOB|nr:MULTISPECIES: DUF1294 domain-containing protein [Defluviimonas]MCU9849084.1 DUF1294 domain-containing protein [Defluviimonas sp. WL0024]MCW3782789.1 DUF1294 domain-containing protein [Defluviimonas salinarum]